MQGFRLPFLLESCILQSRSSFGQQKVYRIIRFRRSWWLKVFLRREPSDKLVDFSRFGSSAFPALFSRPEGSAPGLGLHIIFVHGPRLNFPVANFLALGIAEDIIGQSNAPWSGHGLQAISSGNEEVGTLEIGSRLWAGYARIKLRNVKLGSWRVSVDHLLCPGPVACQQVLQAINGTVL